MNFKVLNCDTCKIKGEQKKNGCDNKKPERSFSLSFTLEKCPILYISDDDEMLELCRLYNLTDGKINFSDTDMIFEKHIQVFEFIRTLDYQEEKKRIESLKNG